MIIHIRNLLQTIQVERKRADELEGGWLEDVRELCRLADRNAELEARIRRQAYLIIFFALASIGTWIYFLR